jgi:hypothetical protein
MNPRESDKKESPPNDVGNLILVYGIKIELEKGAVGEEENTWWTGVEVEAKMIDGGEKIPSIASLYRNLHEMRANGFLVDRLMERANEKVVEYHSTEDGVRIRRLLPERKVQSVPGRRLIPQRT